MPIVLAPIDTIIPDGITDHESFRRWARSDEFPRRGHFAFYRGSLWTDTDMEHAFSHNAVKTEIARVLAGRVRDNDSGQFFGDGMLLSKTDIGLSTEPDGVFVSHERIAQGMACGVGGVGDDYVEMIGTPDMVLEVVSRSSVKKDTKDLPELYFEAGIPEYWLVDARGDKLRFDIHRRGSTAYEITLPDAEGWVRSDVFNRSFRLVRGVNRNGDPKYTLEMRSEPRTN